MIHRLCHGPQTPSVWLTRGENLGLMDLPIRRQKTYYLDLRALTYR